VELFNTNAISAVVTAGSGATYTLEAGYSLEAGYILQDDEVSTTTTYDLPGVHGRLWADYSEFTIPHVVTIVLIATSAVSAGIVRAGMIETFKDPAYGLGEGSNDYSIERELNNGMDYFRKRNVVRTFLNLVMVETRANAFKYKHDIFDAVGPKALAIKLIGNSSIPDDEFVLFAKRIDSPEIEHISRTHSRIRFNFREVV
jgi:hypothetical protein